MDTINRLLKKQAPKRRGRAPGLATTVTGDSSMADIVAETQESDYERGSEVYVRWINNKKGSVVAVPQEWLDAPIGRVFATTASS